jgi:hypothetical protein
MPETKNSSVVLIAAAWLLVAVPLSWGVYKSALNAAKLFTAAPATASTPPVAPK